ncbi:hypothetical protein SKAU_G00052600 [Synaphobranchus kaupii]|uniref:Uncharacterized protein n=1 Tax=Synaphobranchus kaupii TaxID=118154 RepID=A0A9Q1G3G8_SYNKA|nr:hypothetical protein SKAU_G00052600 [Synaphobranchus kaupii]
MWSSREDTAQEFVTHVCSSFSSAFKVNPRNVHGPHLFFMYNKRVTPINSTGFDKAEPVDTGKRFILINYWQVFSEYVN